VPEPALTKDDVNRLVLYHGDVSRAMTNQRTTLESALIPVTAYILVSGIECYRRYPELINEITTAMAPEWVGTAGRAPGNQVDAVHLWTTANMPLVGRQVMVPFGLVDLDEDVNRLSTIFDFWQQAATAFRGDGHQQAWDAGFVVAPYGDDVIRMLLDDATPVANDDDRAAIRRANAALTAYLFLLYFDTRAGYQDTGPYPLPDGRVLLVRDFSEFGVSHFPWSAEVGGDLPYSNLTAALVLDGVDVQVNDWGTAITTPDDYLARLVGYGLFTTDHGGLDPVPRAELADLTAAVRTATRALYRLVAGMSKREKIDAGAYVYFTFLRPFAEVAGVADHVDWTVPRDSLDVYDVLCEVEHLPAPETDAVVPYYTPVP
jgi:hypothetical protein